jgi:hypothetical protein
MDHRRIQRHKRRQVQHQDDKGTKEQKHTTRPSRSSWLKLTVTATCTPLSPSTSWQWSSWTCQRKTVSRDHVSLRKRLSFTSQRTTSLPPYQPIFRHHTLLTNDSRSCCTLIAMVWFAAWKRAHCQDCSLCQMIPMGRHHPNSDLQLGSGASEWCERNGRAPRAFWRLQTSAA